jgi:hypothetical protein
MTPPSLLNFQGDWESYVQLVYNRYHTDIIAQKIYLWGNHVRVRWTPETKGKPFNFWHVVSEGEVEEDRLPDLSRCARISWIAWAITCCDQKLPCVKWWLSERSTRRGRVINLVIWAEEYSYAVVVEPRDGFALLVSAYPVHRRRSTKFAEEYETFWRSPKPIPYWDK